MASGGGGVERREERLVHGDPLDELEAELAGFGAGTDPGGRGGDAPGDVGRIRELRRRVEGLDLEAAREATEGVLDQLYLDRRPSEWDVQELVEFGRTFDALVADLEAEIGEPLPDRSVTALRDALERIEARALSHDRAQVLRGLAHVEGPASLEGLLVQVRAAAQAFLTGSGGERAELTSLLALGLIVTLARNGVDDERLIALDGRARAGLPEALHPLLMAAAAGRLRLPSPTPVVEAERPTTLGPPWEPPSGETGAGGEPGPSGPLPEAGAASAVGTGVATEPPGTGVEPPPPERRPEADAAAEERPGPDASQTAAPVGRWTTAAVAALGLLLVASGPWRLGLLVLASVVAAAAHLGPAVVAAAATMALAAGARLPVTGVEAVDVALAAGWILVVTTGFRRLERSRRGQLPLGLSLMSALALCGGAALAADVGRGLLAFAVAVAAAVAWVVLGRHGEAHAALGGPARVFVGFLLCGLALSPASGPATLRSAVVPVLLFAVPALEVVVSAGARLQPGRSVRSRRSGHLVRRLMSQGRSRAAATRILFGAHALLTATALLVGAGLFPPSSGVTVGVLVVAAVLTLGRPLSHGRPVRPGLLALAALAVLVTLGAPALVNLLRVRHSLEVGAAGARRALDAARGGQSEEAAGHFAQAADAFATARQRLSGPLSSAGLVVPVVSSNVEAVRTLADAGRDVSRTGQHLTRDAGLQRLQVQAGTVPLDEIAGIGPRLSASVDTLQAVAARARAVDNFFVLPPLRRAATDLGAQLASAIDASATAAEAARLLPAILGGDGPRRYFLAVQNNAEARATGGLVGNFGELVVDGGSFRLERFGRLRELIVGGSRERVLRAPPEYHARYGPFGPARHWQNVNMSPDFPTVARVISDLYPQSGGRPVDGVLAVDPVGLAALLELTGPVQIAGWPEPISSENVVRVALRDVYQAFPKGERVDFLGDVASGVMQRVTTGDLGDPRRMAKVLGKAARRRHVMLYLSSAHEQRLVQRSGLAGERRPPRSDSVLVVTQNAASNKVDYYLERRLRYAVELRPEGGTAMARARLEVHLENKAPSRGLPAYVLGPSDPRFAPGENRAYLSVYSPLDVESASLDGEALTLEQGRELGRHVFSAFVSVPASSTRVLALDLAGTVRLGRGGWYEVDLERQPLLSSDAVEVAVTVPPGWRLAEAGGMAIDGRRAQARFALHSDRALRLRVERGAS